MNIAHSTPHYNTEREKSQTWSFLIRIRKKTVSQKSHNHPVSMFRTSDPIYEFLETAFFLDPSGQAADIMPMLEEELTDALQRIAEGEGHSFE